MEPARPGPPGEAARRLAAAIDREFARRFPRSRALHERGSARLVDGVSHTLRASTPFPLWIAAARGGRVTDADGHELVDFWQGHYANLLGHDPPAILGALRDRLDASLDTGGPPALQIGMPHPLEAELAERVARATSMDRVRFTTSGTLATFYALMLARAATGREAVLKVAGGWHGSHVWGLKAATLGAGGSGPGRGGFATGPTPGIPRGVEDQVLVTRFNDPDHLEEVFARDGDRIAAFILEPWMGAAGGIPAHPDYLRAARRLTQEHGALLVADEVITGFRFRAGDACALYGVSPDLIVVGKVLGGGMPLAAVAGRAPLLERCSRIAGGEGAAGGRVWFEGGTYSGHPLCLAAALALLDLVEDPASRLYERLAALGERARAGVEAAFAGEGVLARCTGRPNAAVTGSSIAMVHFPRDTGVPLDRPEVLHESDRLNPVATEEVVKALLLLEGVHTMHGLGALCDAHTEEDLARLFEACRAAGRRLRLAGA